MGYFVLVAVTVLSIVVSSIAIEYPTARRDEKIEEEFFGTKVKDPYRWLERPNSNEVAEYVDSQNDLTFNYLTDCPDRQKVRERLTELWRYPKYGKPEKRGSRYFYYAQQSGKEILNVQDDRTSAPRPLLDSEETGAMIFPHLGSSGDGEVLVYRELIKRKSGSPRLTGNLRLKNVTSDHLYPDVLENIRYPQIAWTKNNNGFFYFSHRQITDARDEGDEESQAPIVYIFYHRLGTQQSQDTLVFNLNDFHKNPINVQLDMEATEDGNYLLLRSRVFNDQPQARRPNSIYLADLEKFANDGYVGKLRLKPIVKYNSNYMKYVTNIGNLYYFRSRVEAKNFRLIEIDINIEGENRERVVVPENPNYILQSASAVAPNKVVLGYTSDATGSYAELRELGNGTLIRMFPLKFGELLSFSSTIRDPEVVFRSQTLEGLPQLSTLDTSQEKATMQPLLELPALTDYDGTLYTSTKVSFPSDDEESREMVLIHRKDIVLDGSSYAFLVEREFDIDFYFRLFFSYMKDYNAVIAIPNLQEADGTYTDSALEDFIASARYLINSGYTSPSKLISRGTGVFGLFVASATNRNPELFGAVIPYMVGFDMVRFPSFTNWSVSASPSDKDDFQRLLGVSPLHNIRLPANESIQYPAILVPTPDNEFPVIFAFKYVAELQYRVGRSTKQTNPFLLRVVAEPQESLRNYARYHIDRETDIRCFLGRTVGLRLP
ncbi:unnamed protein product [Orchesella dallaii]|uniref:Prolyl endopeptidase n=1 Tax=Orchesella dallaii TaxID=48710 RepID=A0ABP1Q0J6_9HEXA